MLVAALYLVGAISQLGGVAFVAVDVRAGRREAREALEVAEAIAEGRKETIYTVGLTGAGPNSQWALHLLEALHRTIAMSVRARGSRATVGAALIVVGTLLNTAASLAALP